MESMGIPRNTAHRLERDLEKASQEAKDQVCRHQRRALTAEKIIGGTNAPTPEEKACLKGKPQVKD